MQNFIKKFSSKKSVDKTNSSVQTGLHFREKLIEDITETLKKISIVSDDIVGLKLFVLPLEPANKIAYENQLREKSFKEHLQRRFDDIFLKLSDDWKFSHELCNEFPNDSDKINEELAIKIVRKSNQNDKKATLKVLSGKTWKLTYTLQPNKAIYSIGRGKTPKLDSGMIHNNDIAFIDPNENSQLDSTNEQINLHVSRFHCSIEYDSTKKTYSLKLAKGLFQKGHVTRILRDSETVEVNNDSLSYPLKSGDQIQFNKKAILEFKLKD